jgi:type II secretory pathway pseudopilin PulG
MAHRTRNTRESERGFTLAGLLVILTIIIVFIAYTVPEQWSMVMGRERDRQTIYAIKQVARALYEFQLKNNGVLPTNLDQIQKARQPRFFRGKGLPVDPVTGEADWLVLPPGAANRTTAPGLVIGGNTQNDPGFQAGARGIPIKDWAGGSAFIGIRPNRTGKSFLALNGQETYEQWTYTWEDVRNEIQARQAALLVK